jgi:glycosyltransferase involved in cell wall biosynthesis
LSSSAAQARPVPISIVTVCFNAASTIERTILSVLAQSYAPIEYIIVDGGSSDGTVDVIRRFEGRISRWISEPDKGMYDAMNKGLAMSSGQYVGILNADDWLEPDAVTVVAATFAGSDCDYTFGDVYLADKDGQRFGLMKAIPLEEAGRGYLYKMPFPHQTCYVSRKLLQKVGMYSLRYRLSSDHDFVVRLVQSGARGAQLPQPIASYRMGGLGGGLLTFRESREIAVRHGMSRIEARLRYWYSALAVRLATSLPRPLVRALLSVKRSRHVWY